MILTHYSTDTGPRANSPSVELAPSWGLLTNGVTASTSGVFLRLITSPDGERTYVLRLTHEEAQSLGAALLKGAASAKRLKDHAELDAAAQG